MASKVSKTWIVAAVLVVAGGVLAYRYWQSSQSALPPGSVSGNGRVEANLTDASAKEPLRVREVLVDEGDLVKPDQLLARLDTSTIDAELAKNEAGVAAAREQLVAATSAIATAKADVSSARADVAGAKADIASANAAIVQEESQIKLAQIEVERERKMLAENATSQRAFDVRQTNLETTKATLTAAQARAAAAEARADSAQARVEAAQARADTSQAQADAARQQIEVALAEVARTKTRIQDAVLVSPVGGRVLYRLAEPGEVLGPGGKALTIVDLSDVYMEIFLPAEQAARLKVGSEARITVDSAPGQSAAAFVSFVSPEAQFTPKQVETKSEREKLMFRVKIQIPDELIENYVERIKTGIRGVGYVKLTDDAVWPEWLERGLVNSPKAGAAPAAAPASSSSDASQTPK
jgi:HlyD family secretion protein